MDSRRLVPLVLVAVGLAAWLIGAIVDELSRGSADAPFYIVAWFLLNPITLVILAVVAFRRPGGSQQQQQQVVIHVQSHPGGGYVPVAAPAQVPPPAGPVVQVRCGQCGGLSAGAQAAFCGHCGTRLGSKVPAAKVPLRRA